MSAIRNNPTSATIDTLTSIWQRVLQLPSIGIEDNFFELGGDSATALELFNSIAETFRRELPPVTIYQASTVAALAALLEDARVSRFPPVVLLRPGDQNPPIFLTHGLGGTVIDFYQVVRNMDTSRRVYGMQARGIDGVDAPFDRIEDMAQYYLQAIKEVQPLGPYLLAGFSLGGLVALEMAQRLTAKGEKVLLLTILDAYPHVRQLSVWQRARFTWQKASREFSEILKLPLAKALHVLTHPSARKALLPPDPFQALADAPVTPAIRQMRDCAYMALQRYQPSRYPGKLRFVKAGVVTCFPENPEEIWAKYAREFEMVSVTADHIGIMTTHAAQTAAVLSRFIRDVTS